MRNLIDPKPCKNGPITVELKPADIILVRGHCIVARIIQFLTGSQFNHAAMVVTKTQRWDRYLIAEAERIGVIFRVLQTKYDPADIAIYRDPSLTEEQRWDVAKAALEMDGMPYDFLMPIRLFKRFGIRYSLKVLMDVLKNPREAKVPHIRSDWILCSEMVQEAYSSEGVHLISDDQLLVPGHVEAFSYLDEIWRGKNVKGTRRVVVD